jgi:hypothetical protein
MSVTPINGREQGRRVLADALRRRTPTWTVAEAILALELPVGDGAGRLAPTTVLELKELAAEASWSGQMSDDFDRVDPAGSQLRVFATLFPEIRAIGVDASDAAALEHLLAEALHGLGVEPGLGAGEALSQIKNVSAPAELSRAGLRKRLRFLRRFEQKISRLRDVQRLRAAQMQAKSRLAREIDPEACDDATLAFCAYLAARANRRSIFQLGEQSKAQDTLAAGLERLLRDSEATAWEQVALVEPTVGVISQLAPGERGRLIGRFHAAMADSAAALAELWPSMPESMRAEMVMVKGVDSSRWNAYAGSFNTMRSAWISAVLAAGLDEILAGYLPGKAPRLMASDLVWMHRNAGRELHVDTRLFAALPRPWDVVTGSENLNRERILAVASELGLDEAAATSGWIGPRAAHEREHSAPEPALVHGVVVTDPALAATLRRCGVFSGKGLRHDEELPRALIRAERLEGERVRPVVTGTVDDGELVDAMADYERELG